MSATQSKIRNRIQQLLNNINALEARTSKLETIASITKESTTASSELVQGSKPKHTTDSRLDIPRKTSHEVVLLSKTEARKKPNRKIKDPSSPEKLSLSTATVRG